MSIFSDALNITLSGWTKAGGATLKASDITAITNYLQSTGFDSFLSNFLAANPASLAAGEVGAANAIPIVYSREKGTLPFSTLLNCAITFPCHAQREQFLLIYHTISPSGAIAARMCFLMMRTAQPI
jgi:hypothetical protein